MREVLGQWSMVASTRVSGLCPTSLRKRLEQLQHVGHNVVTKLLNVKRGRGSKMRRGEGTGRRRREERKEHGR